MIILLIINLILDYNNNLFFKLLLFNVLILMKEN